VFHPVNPSENNAVDQEPDKKPKRVFFHSHKCLRSSSPSTATLSPVLCSLTHHSPFHPSWSAPGCRGSKTAPDCSKVDLRSSHVTAATGCRSFMAPGSP
jgi:hypothetical protein